MGRAEMLARMDSRELTGWMALLTVHEAEQREAEEMARFRRESDDGEVIMLNQRPSEFNDDEDDEG